MNFCYELRLKLLLFLNVVSFLINMVQLLDCIVIIGRLSQIFQETRFVVIKIV